MIVQLLLAFFRVGLKLLTHTHVEGVENVPEPPYLLVTNHLGRLDVPFIYATVGGPHLVGWAAEKYERHLFFGPILRAGGVVFIQRGQVDRRALDFAVRTLRTGKSFAMSPEGTRSPNHALIRGKTGAAYLAEEADVPIVPVGLTGTESAIESWMHLRRPVITARYGPPFRLPKLTKDSRTQGMRANTDEIMCRIAALLPPRYRGLYANYPRTIELLEANGASARSGRAVPA